MISFSFTHFFYYADKVVFCWRFFPSHPYDTMCCWVDIGRAVRSHNIFASRILYLHFFLSICKPNINHHYLYPDRSDCPRGKHWDFPTASRGALWAWRLLVPVRCLELCRHHQEPESLRPHCMWVSLLCVLSWWCLGEEKWSLHRLGERFCFWPVRLCIFYSCWCILKLRPSEAFVRTSA